MEKITELNKIFDELTKDRHDLRAGKLPEKRSQAICRVVNTQLKVDHYVVQRLKLHARVNPTGKK